MKKKILIILISIIVIALIVLLILYNIKNGKEVTSSIETGVKDIDFSSYEEQEITLSNKDVMITKGGVYNITGTTKDHQILVSTNDNVKLKLNNVTISNKSGACIQVESADNIYIELVGNNNLTSTTNENYNGAIWSKNDLLLLGDGTLNLESNLDGIVTKDDLEIDSGTYNINTEDDGIVGRDSIEIDGGNINISSNGDGIKTTNEAKGAIKINDGNLNIDSKKDGFQSISSIIINNGTININTGNGASVTSQDKRWNNSGNTDSTKGIKAEQDITINNGEITINSEDDSIHSNGTIKIKNGSITISSGDDGIHSDKDLTIDDGNITINQSYEGIEGANIYVNNGNISITSSDDGFNAAGGDGSSQGRPGANNSYDSDETYILKISGGTIYVNSSSDGLDSNNHIYISGGTIYVDGPTSNGNGPIDYGDTASDIFEITGGELIAVGSSGMAVAPTDSSTQTSILINLDTSYSGKITFGDITYEPTKNYQSILISSSKLKVGNSYDLKINNETIKSYSLDNTITTIGNSNTGGPNGGPGGMRGRR